MSIHVLPFTKISKDMTEIVGGKGANLGEMTQSGFPVPPGFCITAQAYRDMIAYNNFEPQIRALLEPLDVRDSQKLQKVAHQVMKLVGRANIPPEMVKEIVDNYHALKKNDKSPLVAVRSSATAEDLPDASFAGQQATFLNVKGENNVIEAVRQAWASLFEPRAIFYRVTQKYDHFKVALAIPVQLMVQSEISGIMFTVNPLNGDKRRLVIEAIWGLGEKIVQGAYTPDHYEVNKETGAIFARVISPQTKQYIKHNGKNKEIAIPKEYQHTRKLQDDQILALAQIGMHLQQHYMFPQDVEWAYEDGKLYIVQTRPITTLNAVKKKLDIVQPNLSHLKQILRGDPASPGIVWGTVRILRSPKEINLLKQGEVLVTTMTTPDFVPAMKRAIAIVTDKGGQTSHAAIVSRELGVPAVVGTAKATKTLKTGQLITINGASGEIFDGKPDAQKTAISVTKNHQQTSEGATLSTATKVYVNLGEPDLAPAVATRNVDGVGLLRAEFMMAQIGYHPKKLIHDKKEKLFVEKLADGLENFCRSFGYRPVVYRASDFKTNEYRNLVGGQAFEPTEPNPMLGYRGAYRYITDEKVFELELAAIKEVRENRGYKNLWLMLPFVRTVSELNRVKRIVVANGLQRSNTFKLWMMTEIPSNVIMLEEFAKVGIDGISIGSNDLTMLTLGVDRDNEAVASEYDERDPAVLWMFETLIKKANKLGLTVSMCGQAPSEYPDLTAKLVEWGITSVSVSPDVIERTRQIVSEAEKQLVHKRSI